MSEELVSGLLRLVGVDDEGSLGSGLEGSIVDGSIKGDGVV